MIFLAPGEGRSYELGGMRAIFKVDGAESNGRQCFTEWQLEPGAEGPPPHLHHHHQEAFYVLEGTLAFQIGERTLEATAGSFVGIPAGTVHKFANPTTESARCVNVWIPGGFEGYLIEISDRLAGGKLLDPDWIDELSARYDIFFDDP